MKLLRIFIVIPIFTGLLFFGCESNDSTSSSVYIPQPVNKKILVEFFTNSGCTPCIAAHNYLDQITASAGITLNDTSVIILSYHTKYPYIFDSLYMANPQQNDARSDYYGINYTPQGRIDGITMGQFSSSDWTYLMNLEFNTQKYLNISLSVSFNSSNDSGSVTASITPVTAIPSSDNKLHVVINESNVPYITAPNGVTYPDDVMRYMVTGSAGENISLSVNQTTTAVKQFGLAPNWNSEECFITVFVQSESTKDVYGVERIKIN